MLHVASQLTAEELEYVRNHEPLSREERNGRIWPPVGTRLYATYYGKEYRAIIIECEKYKTGLGVQALNGPLRRKVFRSMTGAMRCMTEEQRKKMKLGRKSMSNGWTWWAWNRKQPK